MTTTSTSGNLTRYLRQMLRTWEHEERSDAELLTLFVRDRNEQAFATLVRRFSVLVWGVCYRILGHREEAEDAFQATFLVLARKADQIRRKEVVGHWLYEVAQRTSQDVRKSLARRHRHEKQASTMLPTAYKDDRERPDLLAVLDEEILRLPTNYRLPLILCRLEGHTYAEAARSLGCSIAAVGRRVTRAEELLRDGLTRRGVTLAGASMAVLLTGAVTANGMPVCLVSDTIQAAQAFVSGTLAPNLTVSIAQGVMRSMASSKAALWGTVLATLIGAAVGVVAQVAPKVQGVVPPAVNAAPPVQREEPQRDRFGDPLPPGALTRLGTMRLRHVNGVQSLAFSRDGKGLITAGQSEPARLWSVTAGRILRQFGDNQDKPVSAAALSPDGRILVGSVWSTGELCLWDVAAGTLLRRLKAEHAGHPARLGFSPDGKTVMSGNGTTLRLWEVATGKELGIVNRLQFAAIPYSSDGTVLIWAGSSGDLHLWDAAADKELRRWDDEKKRPIGVLARAPDGRVFAAYGPRAEAKGLARLWDVATDKEAWRLAGEEGSIISAAFSPDGKVLATGCLHGPIRLWDAATGKELRRCAGGRSARCLAFAPDGKTLASGGGGGIGGSPDQTVHLWDVGSGREVRRADDGHRSWVGSVAFTPDGKDIVSSSWEGSLRVWDAATGEQRRVSPVGDEHFVGGRIASIASAVSSDGKTFISATSGRIETKSSVKVRRWDRDNRQKLRGWSREFQTKAPLSPVISPDGKTVACALLSPIPNQVHLWETATGKELGQITGGYPAFSSDGKLLATAPFGGRPDGPGSLTLWEAATAEKLCSVTVPEGRVYRLLFSPDGKTLATAHNGGRPNETHIYLWPLLRDESRKSGARVGSPRLLAEKVSSYGFVGAWAFSPDTRTLALAGTDGAVQLLETATGKECLHFTGHGGGVTALSFSPDGRRLASGSRDTTILVWDVTGRLQDGRLRAARLTAEELEGYWADLASEDARRARCAIWALASAPAQAVPYMREHLRPSTVDVKVLTHVPQLLRDLDDDAFAVREMAKAELTRLGEAAESALRQALAKSPSLEARRNLEQLLKALEAKRQAPSGEALRAVRALEILEHIGTSEARAALKALTAGARVESSLAQEAHAALERLDRGERR